MTEPNFELEWQIYQRYLEGELLPELAKVYSITPEEISEIIYRQCPCDSGAELIDVAEKERESLGSKYTKCQYHPTNLKPKL